MSFFTLPPEINSLRMFLGAGSAPMLEAAAAWNGLASELGTAAQSFGSVISNLAGQAWQGPASAAMAAAAAPYAGWLAAAASQSQGAATQAMSVVSSFESARAATIHPGAVDQNRNAFVNLVMSNLFGQNAPLIAMAESIYEEMWAADVTAMAGYYSGAAAAAAEVVPWQNVLQSFPALAGGIAGGLSAVAHGAGGGAAGTGDGTTAGGGAQAAAGPTGAAAAAGGGGGSAGGVGSTDSGLAPASYTSGYTGGTPGAADVSGAAASTASPGAISTGAGGFGMMPMPMGMGMGGGGVSRAGLLGDSPSMGPVPTKSAKDEEEATTPETEATETPDAAETQEVDVPAMSVLSTTAGAVAAQAAASEEKRSAQTTTGSGIPGSGLRVVPAAQAQEGAEGPEAETAVATLRPQIAPGEFHRRAAEEEAEEAEAPRLQIRGG